MGIVRADIDLDRRRKASISFKTVFEQFLEPREQKKRDEKYLKELRTGLRRAEPIREKLICEVTSEDLDGILKPYGGRDAGMRYLRSVFNFAKKRKLITDNPISTMEFSEPKKTEVEIIPIADVEKLLVGALAEDLELLPHFVLGFFCGIRPDGELQELQWSDLPGLGDWLLLNRGIAFRDSLIALDFRRSKFQE